VEPDEHAVLFNCGNGLKYPMPPSTAQIDHTAIDWDAIERA
jgi:threonine synthase